MKYVFAESTWYIVWDICNHMHGNCSIAMYVEIPGKVTSIR